MDGDADTKDNKPPLEMTKHPVTFCLCSIEKRMRRSLYLRE